MNANAAEKFGIAFLPSSLILLLRGWLVQQFTVSCSCWQPIHSNKAESRIAFFRMPIFHDVSDTNLDHHPNLLNSDLAFRRFGLLSHPYKSIITSSGTKDFS